MTSLPAWVRRTTAEPGSGEVLQVTLPPLLARHPLQMVSGHAGGSATRTRDHVTLPPGVALGEEECGSHRPHSSSVYPDPHRTLPEQAFPSPVRVGEKLFSGHGGGGGWRSPPSFTVSLSF